MHVFEEIDGLLQVACIVDKGSHKAVTIVVKGIERTFRKALIAYCILYSMEPY